jgi:phospholipase C
VIGVLVLSHYRLADEFVLLDRYFQSIHGGSFANHFFLITAAVARDPDVSDDELSRLTAGAQTTLGGTCYSNSAHDVRPGRAGRVGKK